jgi:outer membrane protein OmpA-like peptidoglycan-associated protein
MKIRKLLIASTALSMLTCATAPAQQPPQAPAAGDEKQQPPGQKKAPQAQPGKQLPPAAQGQPSKPATAQEQPKQPEQKRDTQHPPGQPPGAPGRAQGQQPAAPAAAPAAQEKQQEKKHERPQRPAQTQPPAPGVQDKKHDQQRPAQSQPPAPGGAQDKKQDQPQRPAQTQPPQPPAAQGQPVPRQQPAERSKQPQQPAAQTPPAQPQAPAAQTAPAQPAPPAAQSQPARPQPPAAQTVPAQPQLPAAQATPAQPQAPTAQQQRPIPPAAQGQPIQLPGTNARRVDELRGERRETREGNRVVIQEQDRTIIREGGRTIIRHNEVDRFRYGARDVRVERQGAETITVIERPDGARIVTVTDANGRLLRRSRRDPAGREVVIIDNRGGPATGSYFVELPPLAVRIPRERYIVEAERASEADIYATLVAQPVERLARRYTLDEIRQSPQVRERMPRIDIDTINFETGSWDVTPDQAPRLAVVAAAIKRAVGSNPGEVFLIEGHTDAVGADVDNLSLSDRRAESVALVLTEQFQVPAENLTSQGYGEQSLKVKTEGPEQQNRRVTMRRITPLLSGGAPQQPGG